MKRFTNVVRKAKKGWFKLSFNQKLTASLAFLLILVGLSQFHQSIYYGNKTNRGDIKIFIDKYKGDSWNAKDEKKRIYK